MNPTTRSNLRGYELQECLGQGGFGAVYRAFQPAVAREVAVKIILPEYANQREFILRFEAEAQLVARLEHPYIVPLYDFWRDPEGAYLVMRLIRGGNLRHAINKQAIDLVKTLNALDQISQALDIAHRQHVVHRDLKPDNILLDEEGNAYLSDFGIAQVLKTETGEDNQPGTDTLTGSMGYISPEQARGDALSPRSDIYSLAVIAYELLAGRHPFYQFSPTIQMVKHLTENLPPIAHFRADLPSRVDEVLHRATAKKPDERFGTAGDFIHALKIALGEGNYIVQSGQTVTFDTKTKPIEAVNPYKGLRPFEEADVEDFFGRDALVRKLIERLETPTTLKTSNRTRETEPFRFLAVVGPSGSGKSSVVKAGLLPALRRGFLPGSARWVISQMTPGNNPMAQLENELLSISARQVKNFSSSLRASPQGLANLVPEILPDLNTEALLVIDQFEEVFTSPISEKERTLFLDSLRTAVSTPESRLRVIITLRADFYDRPLMYAGFGALLQKRTEVVLPLTANELTQAIFAPAERVGIAVERGLAIEIAGEVVDQPGGLPLLQYALTELFERRDGHIMTRQAYHALGGVLGALTRRADEVFQALTEPQQTAAKTLFMRLVTLGEGAEDTRRRVLRAELETLSPEIGRVIEIFGKARLLSYDRDPATRTPTVEVAHEALIREWKVLREWLNENRETIRIQMHLTHAAQDWDMQGRDAGDLYRGARFAQAREWAETHSTEINQLERAFLAASIEQLERETAELEGQRQRELETARKLAETEKQRAEEQARAASRLRARGRFLAGLLGLTVVLLFGVGWFGYQAILQRREADTQRQAAEQQRGLAEQNFLHSEQLRLSAQANSNLLSGIDLDTAPLLALAALKMGYLPEADQTLQRAMTYVYPTHILTGHAGTVSAVAISPNGQVAATTSGTTTFLWELTSGQQLRTFSVPDVSMSSLAFSPDGRWLAASGDDLLVHVWEVATGVETLQLSGHTDYIWSVAWSPDGRQLASVGLDQTVQLWEIARGASLLVIEMPTAASSLAFSPNGGQILVAGDDHIARLYDASGGELLRGFFGHRAVVISVAFSHSGQYILTCSDDKTARIWETATGSLLTQLVGHQDSVYDVDFTSDDRYVVTAGYDRQAILWDRESGVIMQRFIGHQGSLYGIDLSANDRWLLTGSVDGTARLWPTQLDSQPRAFRHRSPVLSISVSADGKRLGVGTTGGNAYLWDTESGRELFRLAGHEYPIESVALSPDGKYLATAGDDYTLRLWLTETGKQVRNFDEFSASIWAVRFAPDGKTLAAAGDGGLSLWSTFGGSALHQLDTENIYYTASFSPDGKYLLAGGASGLALFDTQTGELVKTIEKSVAGSYFASAISPDGRYAVLGGGELLLLEFPSLNVVKTLAGHTGAVLSAAFSPDGARLLTSSEDGTARLWDLSSGETLRVISSLQALANSAAFSPDGQQIYVGGADNVVWKWDVDYQELITYACSVLKRDLTPDERQKYSVPLTAPVCGP